MRTVANVLSVVFHPILMCSYGSIIFFFLLRGSVFDFMTSTRLKWVITSMVFSFTTVLPCINIFILYKLGRISSLSISNQKERTFPYVVTSCFYFGLFYLFIDLNIWASIKILIFGGGLAILLTALINMRYKISAHMIGIGGLIGSLAVVSAAIKYDSVAVACLLVFIAGLVGTGRLYLQAHRPSEIYSGFLLGFVVQIIVFISFQSFNFT